MHQHKINGLYFYGQGAGSPKSGRKERSSNATSPTKSGPVQTISSSSLGIQGTKSYVNKARSENWDVKTFMKLETVKKTHCAFKCVKSLKDGHIVTNARTSVLFASRCKSLEGDLDTMHRIIRVGYSYELSADPMVAMTYSGVQLLQITRWRVILASTTCTTMARQMTWDRTLRSESDGPGGPSHGRSHSFDLWNVLHASLYRLSESVW